MSRGSGALVPSANPIQPADGLEGRRRRRGGILSHPFLALGKDGGRWTRPLGTFAHPVQPRGGLDGRGRRGVGLKLRFLARGEDGGPRPTPEGLARNLCGRFGTTRGGGIYEPSP